MAQRLTRRARAAGIGVASLVLLVIALRVAVQRLPWFGPWLADSLRPAFALKLVSGALGSNSVPKAESKSAVGLSVWS